MKNLIRLFFVFACMVSQPLFATKYTWTGTTSTNWTVNTNWSPNGVPLTTDTVKIVTRSNNPVLQANTTVKELEYTSGSLNLNTYSLTISNNSYFYAGTISNGNLIIRGTYSLFNGTTFSCTIDAIVGRTVFSGGTFNNSASFEQTSTSNSNGAGGCTFNAAVTIKKTGNSFLNLGITNADVFNGVTKIINTSTYAIQLGYNTVSSFNDSLILESTGSGGVNFATGSASGGATLASGKVIRVGAGGFTNGSLVLKNFTQNGSTAQSITTTSSAIVSLVASTFNGALTISSPGILLKTSTFNGVTEFIKSSTSSNQSDGGNTFNAAVTFRNTALNTASFRLALQERDIFNSDVTFITTNGYISPAYTGVSEFKGNITTNSNRAYGLIVFNISSGTVSLTGSGNQTISGDTTFLISKLLINKIDGQVNLNRSVIIDSILNLTKGKLISSVTNLLTLKSKCIVEGGNNLSFISGPIRRIGNTSFTFPVGDINYYPISISAPQNSTDAYQVLYKDSAQNLGSLLDSSQSYLSDCRWFSIQRTSGVSKVKISVNWINTESICERIIPETMSIVKWDSIKWAKQFETTYSGDYSSGTLTSDSVSKFGNFTIAAWAVPFSKACAATSLGNQSQAFCIGSTSTEYTNRYGTQQENIPSVNQEIKNVLVNINVYYDNTSATTLAKHWNPSNSNDVNNLTQILQQVNDLYKYTYTYNQTPPNIPSGTIIPVVSSRIQFDWQINWIADPIQAYENSESVLYNNLITSDPQKANQLNYFMVIGNWIPPNQAPGWGRSNINDYFNLSAPSYNITWNGYRNGVSVGYYNLAQHIAHELGHSFGLFHTYPGSNESCNVSSADYLWDIFGYPPGSLCLFPNNNTSNDLMGGHSEYTSPLQIGRMHRALSFSNMRKYVDDLDPIDNQEIVVSSDETWTFDFKCYRHIRVRNNAKLTLKCNLILKKDAKIIVEDGSRLILDGAHVYTEAGLWSGIEVWGNRNQSQFPLATTSQGLVEFKNGSLVENARDVVTTIKYDPSTDSWDWSKTGGIVIADGCTFKNNKRVFQFLSYHNFRTSNPNYIYNNLSSIKNCVFETTYNLIDYTVYPHAFITMYDVDNIKIQGNIFRNTSTAGLYDLKEKGNGIVSIDTRYSLRALGNLRNSFENLYYGVYTSNSIAGYPLNISGTDFENCYKSIYSANTAFASIKNNSFIVRDQPSTGPNALDNNYGIYLDNSPLHLIENNNIESYSTGGSKYGIVVNNCGDETNWVYNNDITGFGKAAIYAIGDNDGPFLNDGLRINCDDFRDQLDDEIVVAPYGSSGIFGIGDFQGDCNTSSTTSRNRFYSNVCSSNGLEIKIGGLTPSSIVQYASSNLSSNAFLTCSTPTLVNNNSCSLNFNKSTDCPPLNFTPSSLKDIVVSYQEQVNGYLESIDEGVSSTIDYRIEKGELDTNDIIFLRSKSPYIHPIHLTKIIDHIEDYCNQSGFAEKILELFLANCKLHQSVYNKLLFKSQSSECARVLLENLQSSLNNTNVASQLLLSLDEASYLRNFYTGRYVNEVSISEDTIDQAIFKDTLLLCSQNIGNKRLIHDAYASIGEYSIANAYIDSIDYNESGQFLGEILYSIDTLKSRNSSGLFDNKSSIEIYGKFKDEYNYVGAISRAYLTLNSDSLFNPPLEEEGSGSRFAKSNENLIEVKSDIFQLYPNPANSILQINFIPQNNSVTSYSICILDVYGRKIFTKENCTGLVSFDVSNIKDGIYLVEIWNQSQRISSKKFLKHD